MMSKSSYRVTKPKLQETLEKAKHIVFRPADEENEFPQMLVVFDGGSLPRDPEERKKMTDRLYEILFHALLTDLPPGGFHCNFTSLDTQRNLSTLANVRELAREMPLPHHQSDEPPDTFYLQPDYVVQIESRCHDPEEHRNFATIAKVWKQYIRQQQRPSV